MTDLSHHGDAELAPGLVDLAVNVRHGPMPPWLAGPIAEAMTDLGRYPDAGPARDAIAARHARNPDEVLITAGAAQAFVLIAQALRGIRRPVVVHPQFTEPEAALLAAGHAVDRVLLPPPFVLDPAVVPAGSDLVLIGNPTNPTSILHPGPVLAELARGGRILVVDEAFADTVPGEPESLAARTDLPGLVIIRSLTKTWGLAGLRVGYLLAPADLVARLATAQPLWAVSTPALAAARACATPEAIMAEKESAVRLSRDRAHLTARLAGVPGVTVTDPASSSFVLVRVAGGAEIRRRLRDRGFAVRRGDTFPGLGPDWLRVAVRDTATTDAFVDTLLEVV